MIFLHFDEDDVLELNSLPKRRLNAVRQTKGYSRVLGALREIAPQNAKEAQKITSAIYIILEQYRAFRHKTTAEQSMNSFLLACQDYCEEASTLGR